MKTMYHTFLFVFITAITFSACARRVYVSERPAPPPLVAVRPALPHPGAVWISEEYVWRGGRYVYVAPHYVSAPRGRVWVSGYWNTHRGRSVWVKGHWRR
ncbi:MAG: hypothetical protein QM768_19835 [Agriterribacter sp.]